MYIIFFLKFYIVTHWRRVMDSLRMIEYNKQSAPSILEAD